MLNWLARFLSIRGLQECCLEVRSTEMHAVRGHACSSGTCAAVTETAARRVRAPAVFSLLCKGGPARQH